MRNKILIALIIVVGLAVVYFKAVDTKNTIQPPKTYGISDYDSALAKAKKQQKKVFIVFHAEWCHWCHKLEADTLSKPSVQEKLKDYVVLHVDADAHRDLARQYGARGLPSYVVTDADGVSLKKGSGYKTVSGFLEWLGD